MILKHADGTVVEMTTAEFVELGNVFGDVSMDPEKVAEAVVEGMTEATADFKVGDKVEVIGVTYMEESRYSGEIGVIKKVFHDGDLTVEVRGEGRCIYPPSSLKLIEEEPEEVLSEDNVKFEVGDVVESDGLFAKIFDDFDSDNEYRVGFFKGGSFTYLDESEMRHATEEEKSQLQTLIGREKDEYKIGDLVELLGGGGSGYSGREGYIFEVDKLDGSSMPIHLKDNGNKTVTNLNTWSRVANLKLITPVEWRHDFVGGA